MASFFPNQELNPNPVHCKADSQPLNHQRGHSKGFKSWVFERTHARKHCHARPLLSKPGWTGDGRRKVLSHALSFKEVAVFPCQLTLMPLLTPVALHGSPPVSSDSIHTHARAQVGGWGRGMYIEKMSTRSAKGEQYCGSSCLERI